MILTVIKKARPLGRAFFVTAKRSRYLIFASL